MIRCIGCLLIALAGMGMGLYGACRLRRRAAYIQQTQRLLQALECQLPYTAQPLAVLWRRLADTEAYGDCRLLRDTAAELASVPFDTAFAAAVERARTEGLLTSAGLSLLLEFGAGCGRYDLTRQTEHIRYYRRQLEDLAAELSRYAAAKGRLYRVAGLAGGVALALLLL